MSKSKPLGPGDPEFDAVVDAVYVALTLNPLTRKEYLAAASIALARARAIPTVKVTPLAD